MGIAISWCQIGPDGSKYTHYSNGDDLNHDTVLCVPTYGNKFNSAAAVKENQNGILI